MPVSSGGDLVFVETFIIGAFKKKKNNPEQKATAFLGKLEG